MVMAMVGFAVLFCFGGFITIISLILLWWCFKFDDFDGDVLTGLAGLVVGVIIIWASVVLSPVSINISMRLL